MFERRLTRQNTERAPSKRDVHEIFQQRMSVTALAQLPSSRPVRRYSILHRNLRFTSKILHVCMHMQVDIIESSGFTDSGFNSVYMTMANAKAQLYRMPPLTQGVKLFACVSPELYNEFNYV
ncbi:hypothetical protein C0J50_17476 [Silurus asotus]|uniref:Uncharacterized protein n=1 Tax=Silurus asotus TaxID=30991 RepID=A0AAD5AUC5_SILAS|nr:hypothetical protein C0J50_17476 [Silurus asotus]